MTDPTARVSLSLHDGKFEIAGPEPFVTQQVERFHPLIERLLSESRERTSPRSADQGSEAGAAQNGSGLEEYDDTFAVADGRVQILRDIPGSKTAQKMVNATLLHLFASSLIGVEEVPFDVLRDVCKSHGCLDSKNFASTIKDEKELFIVSGTNRRQSAKLTKPGRNKAEAMVRDLKTV